MFGDSLTDYFPMEKLNDIDAKIINSGVAVCAMLMVWEHGNRKTGINICYSITFFLYANTGRNFLCQSRYRTT